MRRPRALFVGAFVKTGTKGHTGGQTFACTTLVESEWGKSIHWILLDTSATTNDKRSFWVRLRGAIRRLFRMIKLLRREEIDVVMIFCSAGWSYVEKGVMARLAKWYGLPVIFFPQSGLILNDLENSSLMRAFVKRTVQKVDRVVCQGIFWKRFYQNLSKSPDERFIVIYNWIFPDKYLKNIPDPINRSTAPPMKILFLGWITPNKGVFDLLEAADLIKDLPIKIIMGGKGTHFDELARKVKERNLEEVMELRGWINGEEKMAAFRESDAFVLSSYREGFPNALLEAMVSGLPCVATSISSIPDVITHGENGYLVEPGQPAQLADMFVKLQEDPIQRVKMGNAAREWILEHSMLENVTQQIEEAFSELIRQ